ncbi:MAG: DNA topoisomerase, partial [Suipraeoptans sp.]
DSMNIIQKLYESGYITYPRTNTEYLAENESDKVDFLIQKLNNQGHNLIQKKVKKIYDNSKIESHSALTPTANIPTTLSGNEEKVYQTVLNRFLAVFSAEECIVMETIVSIQIKDEILSLKGTSLKQKGFMKYDGSSKDKMLPVLKQGDKFPTSFKPVETETQPPKLFTTETLTNYLKNPFRKEANVSEDELYKNMLEGVEIGTEATRTGIIANAINNEYISLVNDVYNILPIGVYMVELGEQLNIDISTKTTVDIGKLLKKVYRLETSVDEAVSIANHTIEKSFEGRNIAVETVKTERAEVGKCPRCNGTVYKGKKAYYCEDNECKFALFPTMKFYDNAIKISDSKAKLLLGKTRKAQFSLKNKQGKPYSAYLRIKLNGDYVNFEIDGFVQKKNGRKKRSYSDGTGVNPVERLMNEIMQEE